MTQDSLLGQSRCCEDKNKGIKGDPRQPLRTKSMVKVRTRVSRVTQDSLLEPKSLSAKARTRVTLRPELAVIFAVDLGVFVFHEVVNFEDEGREAEGGEDADAEVVVGREVRVVRHGCEEG